MVVGGFIAHHQVYAIFQGLPRQVPPDHMCHPWPIGRVQNFIEVSDSLRFFCQTNFCGLCRLFFWRPIMGHFFRRKIEILFPPNRLGTIFADFSVIWRQSAELHYTNCVPDFCWKKISAELSIQTYAWAELIFSFCMVLCSGLLLIQCLDLGFLLKIFYFWRNSTSQNVCLTSADLGYFSAEIRKSGDAWLPMIPLHVHFPMWNLTCTSHNGK